MKRLLVAVPCRENHIAMIEKTVAGRMEIVFSEDPKDVPGASVIVGEPQVEDVLKDKEAEWIHMTWAGTDQYSLDPNFPNEKVKFSNIRGVYGTIISEYVVGAVLSICRRFPKYLDNKKRELWEDAGPEYTLEKKTVVVLGAGNVGGTIAKKLKVFDTYNIAFGLEPFVPEGFDEIHKMDELHTYLPKADVLVCCLPGIGTAHLIGEEELRLLKDDAILVNVGRGTLIDNLALASVMREGKLLGAALDVTDPEPLPGGHPLWGIDNLIITPHVAGPTFCHCPLTEDKVIAQVCANLEKYLEDGSFPNQVN